MRFGLRRHLGSCRALPRDDVALALSLAAVSLLQVLWLLPIASRPVGALVALASTLPVAWRRIAPVPAVLVGTGVWLVPTDGYLVLGYVAALFLYYSLGAHVASARAVVAICFVGVAVAVAVSALRDPQVGELAGAVLAVVAPTAVGVLVRSQRGRAEQLALLAEVLERDRDLRADAAVADERRRIARELHDIVSHALSVISVQAEAAQAALAVEPERAARPLEIVHRSAQDALGEMRRLLGVLRVDEEDGHEPLPGIAELDALIARARESGLPVSLFTHGEPRAVPASVDLCIFRLVQESLTNVLKHAGGHVPVEVALTWEPDVIEVTVHDHGRGSGARGPVDAHGLVGLRERVVVHGGTFSAGPASDGGFLVSAVLPVRS